MLTSPCSSGATLHKNVRRIKSRLWRMAERLHGRQNDNSLAGPPHSPLRYHRNRKRQLALQEPWRGSPDNPRSRRLRNPDPLRRRERYQPDPSLKGVPFGCKSGVPIGCRLTANEPTISSCAQLTVTVNALPPCASTIGACKRCSPLWSCSGRILTAFAIGNCESTWLYYWASTQPHIARAE